MKESIISNIFSVTPTTFIDVALQVFNYQYETNEVYSSWVNALGVSPSDVTELNQIPFLPISAFKSHQVLSGYSSYATVFESSGTTGTIPSRHYVKDISVYRQSFMKGFQQFYGAVSDWCIIGLLPSYLERQHSSLVMMVDELIKASGHQSSGFYLNNFGQLSSTLSKLEEIRQNTLLIGVTFALLDFADQYPMHLQHTTIMETGGMKGRRKEMIRAEVHDFLTERLQVPHIHSEYGMTELLSQAYSRGNGVFHSVPWLKILVRDEADPLQLSDTGRGLINVIDLANIHSCSFIATDDVGRLGENGSFEVLGRMDTSDVRGCSLLTL